MQVINALVVDDEPDSLGFLAGCLRGDGLSVAEAPDAENALSQLQGFKPEVIVADVRLPGLSGYDLCRRVRELGHDDIPFIFCSALGGLPERVRGLRMGGDAYLVKPVAPDELLLHVRLHVDRTRRLRELRSAAASHEAPLSGDLAEVSLQEVLQLLDMRGRDELCIAIEGEDGPGEVYVNARELVHAGTATLTGRKALGRMLARTRGTFRVEPHTWLGTPSLSGRIDHVLFDACGALDDTRALRARLPDVLTLAPSRTLYERQSSERVLEVLRLVETHGRVDAVLDTCDLPDDDVLRILLEAMEAGLAAPGGEEASATPPTAPSPDVPRVPPPPPPPSPERWEGDLQQLRRDYVAGAAPRLQSARNAIAELMARPERTAPLGEAIRAFHAFSGSGSTYGFPAVTARGSEAERLCVELERSGKPIPPEPLRQLRRLIADIEDALTSDEDAASPPAPATENAVDTRRVLIVDPNPSAVQPVAQVLRRDGIAVRIATSRSLAVREITRLLPDALVVESRLSDGPSYDLVSMLRSRPGGDKVGVVVVGSPGEFLDKVEAIHAGADAVLEKPLAPLVVQRTLRRLLQRVAGAPGRVLAIEDDPQQVAFYELVLGAAGYEVRCCSEPSRLEAELAEFLPDLVLMDVLLPGVQGFDLVRFIRQDERWAALPVLLVTTLAHTRARAEAAACGADGILVKPLRAWLLLPAVAARIEHARLMRGLIEHDGLTRLLTHSPFLERAQGLLAQAVRDKSRRLALALVDVDGMREINARHGHLAGDRVLTACGALLRQRLRQSDAVARYGGDEFAVVLTDLEDSDAVRLLTRLGDEFAALAHATRAGDEPVRATFSAGVAKLDAGQMDLARWIRAAEEALADARSAGVGRVHLA